MLSRMGARRLLLGGFAVLGLVATMAMPAGAASHRDSPLISLDPAADQNDLYAFVSRNDGGTKVLNLIASYIPLEEAADGPNYYKFDDNVLYELNIANTGLTGKPDLSFEFRFKTTYRCTRTFLTLGIGSGCDDGATPDVGTIQTTGDPHQNLQQTYSVIAINRDTNRSIDLTAGMTPTVPPDNIGRTTPGYNQGGNGDNPAQTGAQTTAALDPLTASAIYTLPGGIKVFAGQRSDHFYADLAATFDLLNLRSPGVNSLQGYNVHVIAMQIPLALLASPRCPNGECIMGVYTASYRRAVTVRPADGGAPVNAGPWRQVGRMGNPLFNEIFVALDDKDRWNQSQPVNDAQFKQYALNPEPVRLLNAVLGLTGGTTNRTDLAAIFIPDLLRVDTSTEAVPLQAGDPIDASTAAKCYGGNPPPSTFSTLSVFGNDKVWSPFQNACVPSGWPNGRRLADDVVAITVDAGEPGLNGGFSTGLAGTAPVQNHVFPFSATPYNGRNHAHAPQ